MSYMHIGNLYKAQEILSFKECYAMEKIHGTSAHISWGKEEGVSFFWGGANKEQFLALFNPEELNKKFASVCDYELNGAKVIVYGEAYGGKLQGMKETYGDKLKFVAFEVKIGDSWLSVPKAEKVAVSLGLDFVPYVLTDTSIESLDNLKKAPSVQAIKNGIFNGKIREGIVLRPPFEVKLNNGGRVIAKYKNDEFMETKTSHSMDETKRKLWEDAKNIAEEWVTPVRLSHVIDKVCGDFVANITHTERVIKAMIEDVEREAEGEIVKSKEARKEIGHLTVKLFKQYLMSLTQKVI